MRPEAARTVPDLQLLDALVHCAGKLALRFGEAAEAETDLTRCLELHAAFDRGFLAVRMGIRLSMTLRAGPKQPAANDDRPEATSERERLADRPDRDPGDRDRDREREYEPVSLPKFLSTLRGVAADARRLPGEVDPTVLPTLEDLLARAKGETPAQPPPQPKGGVAVLSRPPAARHRLMSSTSAPLTIVPARPPPRPSG